MKRQCVLHRTVFYDKLRRQDWARRADEGDVDLDIEKGSATLDKVQALSQAGLSSAGKFGMASQAQPSLDVGNILVMATIDIAWAVWEVGC